MAIISTLLVKLKGDKDVFEWRRGDLELVVSTLAILRYKRYMITYEEGAGPIPSFLTIAVLPDNPTPDWKEEEDDY